MCTHHDRNLGMLKYIEAELSVAGCILEESNSFDGQKIAQGVPKVILQRSGCRHVGLTFILAQS